MDEGSAGLPEPPEEWPDVEFSTVTGALRFPEGPVAMDDGSVLVVEIERGTLSRVAPDGSVDVVAEPGGGPNGAAVGPDGKIWLANNGGCFSWIDLGEMVLPGPLSDGYDYGRIERVDIDTGAVEVLYTECDGHPLRAPNDLVMDGHGGFWFTDHGLREERSSDRTGVYYALCDGSFIAEVLFPLDAPNGIGLSPEGDRLHVAETFTGRVWSWSVPEPGVATGEGLLEPHGELLVGLAGLQYLDSLAVDGDGNVCVATLNNGGITVVSPDGASVRHLAVDDPVTTNICFGGDDLRAAWVTASSTGRLLRCRWPVGGMRLAHQR